MKLSSSSLSLLVLGAQSLCTSAWISAPPSALSQRALSASLVPRRASVETSVTPSETPAAADGLLPDFEGALVAAKAKLMESIPSDSREKMGGMLPMLDHFMTEYTMACQNAYLAGNTEDCEPPAVMKRILTGITYGLKYGMGEDKFIFDVSHMALRGDPEKEDGNMVDFYDFGCEFFRPCMDMEKSQVLGIDNVQLAVDQLAKGDNVVLLANHQSEADPQVVSILLEKAGFPSAASDAIYIAGHKVTTDALAIPFSMGRNLICIHSKKHMNADPSLKPVKQRQNLKAMSAMLKKMKNGSCLLWVAPSGGRDRRDVETGEVPIAPFDSKTIDMFRLMGTKSKVPTHYYTLAMISYDLCPPPDAVEAGVGEQRNIRFGPVGINMGNELQNVGGLESRHLFCDRAMEQCSNDNEELVKAIEAASSQE